MGRRDVPVELVPISTRGDRQRTPIGMADGTGLFTKELQLALLEGRIDLAVHSLKDLPTEAVDGLELTAVPRRGPVADALVCLSAGSLDELPAGATVGTGSLRRRAQLLHGRPDLKAEPIRGNVDTRLRKLEEGRYDALVLAQAGLQRLGLADRITQLLPADVMLPAVGQGALGIEARCDDPTVQALIRWLDDSATRAAVTAERAMLRRLQGGCLAPVAAWGRVEHGQLILTARVLSPDGRQKKEVMLAADPVEAEGVGLRVAEELIAQGADELIRSARRAV